MPPRLLLAIALALALTAPARAFEACFACAAPDATVLPAGTPAFTAAVSASLFPSPSPGYVAAVSSAADVAAVVKCAVESGLPVCMRSGGHSFSGRGMGGKGCVLVDVIGLNDFSYDAGAGTVQVGAGVDLGKMFLRTFEATGGTGLVGIGLCPSVGIAGYLAGGGFGPYSSSLGLTCESVQEFRIVLADGSSVTANAGENAELFWATCGGGGGSFGIITSAVVRPSDASKFNRNVYFRYQWPGAVAGEVAHKFVDYDDDNGNMWVRVELSANEGAVAFGVCWASDSVEECEGRLGRSAFFNVEGRTKVVAQAGKDAAEFQKFIGPGGSWAREVPTKSNEEVFIGTYGAEAGMGLKRVYSSLFTNYGGNTPPQEVFDAMSKKLNSEALKDVVSFNLVQFNPWRGEERADKPQFAFAHRNSNQLIEFVGAVNDSLEGAELEAALNVLRSEMDGVRGQLEPWRNGVYVNYPSNALGDGEYPGLYYGSSLGRLSALRGSLDPNGVFIQKQQIAGSGGA